MLRNCALALFATALSSGVLAAQVRHKDMDLVITAADAMTCGHDYSNASARLTTVETRDRTFVVLVVRGAKPNHLHTLWLKLAMPSPLTSAGATPAAPTHGLGELIMNAGTPSAAGANAFYTNSQGNGALVVPLDFRVSDGMYPFSLFRPTLMDTAIGHMPFTFRVISHCTDNIQHGPVPGPHEPTFQTKLQ